MESDLQRNIRILDHMIERVSKQPFKGALIFAYNRLIAEWWKIESTRRKPEDYPYCSVCGAAYLSTPTSNPELRVVSPACDCHGEVYWGKRPEIAWDEASEVTK